MIYLRIRQDSFGEGMIFVRFFAALVIFLSLGGIGFAQLKTDYEFQFPGWKQIKPTQLCSVMDLILVMQSTQAKLMAGSSPDSLALFEGEIPSPHLRPISTDATPKKVAQTIWYALNLFISASELPDSVPDFPDRKIYPADVLVYASQAFDMLGKHLQDQGVRKLGDFSLLRFRYVKRLQPHDCLQRANLILTNWQDIYR